MTRLYAAELDRLRSRRVTLVAGLVVLAAVGLFQLVVHEEAAPPTAAEVAENRQAFEESQRDWEANHDRYLAECVQSGETQADCEADFGPPSLDEYGLEPVAFDEIAGFGVTTAAYLAMLGAFLVAASFIGAEYSTGSLANWLTFVPQRLKVFASKALAVVAGSALFGAVVAFTMSGLAALQVSAYGQPLVRSGHIAAASGRVVVLAAVAGLVGFGLALLTRHTVAAIAAPLAYLIVAVVLSGLASDGSGSLAWLPPYLPHNNVTAFLERGSTYLQYVDRVTPDGLTSDELVKHISFAHSSVYWLVVAVVTVVVGAAVFRRRDVI